MKGLVIGGEFNSIIVRQKADEMLEIGEILICENHLLQVVDLRFGSQLSAQGVELASGLMMEGADVTLMDEHVRQYILGTAKNLVTLDPHPRACKSLPPFFGQVREVQEKDLQFLSLPQDPLILGKIRSASKVLDVAAAIDGPLALAHHMLVCGATGKGKSNLMRNLLWAVCNAEYCGLLVLDPHDEYYGRARRGLKDHPRKPMYFARNPPAGGYSLMINIQTLLPWHFEGIVEWSEPQRECLMSYFRQYRESWIEAVIAGKDVKGNFFEATLQVIQRRLQHLLGINERLMCSSCFCTQGGLTTVRDIILALRTGKKVIVNTSDLSGSAELLVGSMIATDLLYASKEMGLDKLHDLPTVSVVLEEAPRVLGQNCAPNIFGTIAREGRKFKVGLIAITQLPSLIPREILANMNTKIILGMDSKAERQAIIDSASTDLSSDDRMIASLDRGEAIVSSSFLPFAIPLAIEMFKQ